MRKISKTRYVSAALLTFLIFFFGLLLGFFFENVRISKMYEELQVKKIEFTDLNLQNKYIDYLSDSSNCDAMYGLYYKSMEDLDDKRIQLENYYNMAKIKTDEYLNLKKEYTISSLEYWLLAEKLKNQCNSDYSIILYFYGTEQQCEKCDDQGVHLSYIKKMLNDKVLVFALDSNMKGTIDLLKETLDVKSLPTVIINDKKFNYINNVEILDELCSKYNYSVCYT
jgi:hypothetical protein